VDVSGGDSTYISQCMQATDHKLERAKEKREKQNRMSRFYIE